ncbi:hypothetical protein KIM67_18435 [Flagellimonas sp. 389]|uniref:hypothetical protein n=1 Tax=Flagellimonas sp. 389 TaxID=2835862 RepID=UPI001BD4D154|nr:hypothetical protein [Flagellimonas sp. 389]MBS9464401.1 hypothetical protein [Flagellimonas sp. 389]
MYFEDIYNKIRPLWKKRYFLGDVKNTKTYIKNLADDWEEIDYLVSYREEKKHSAWEKMMLFVMYQTLTEYSLEQSTLGKQTIDLDEIPIARIEEKYRENLQFEGNEEYLKKYKGFKNPQIAKEP